MSKYSNSIVSFARTALQNNAGFNVIKSIINMMPDFNGRSECITDLMMDALRYNSDVSIIQWLIAQGGNINFLTFEGNEGTIQ